MIGWKGDDVRQLGECDLIVSMKEIGAESSNGAPLGEHSRPKSAHMSAVGQLIFIHEPERSWKWLAKTDSSRCQTFSQSFGEILQHLAAPGKSPSLFRLSSAWKEIGLPFNEVVFDSLADLLGSE